MFAATEVRKASGMMGAGIHAVTVVKKMEKINSATTPKSLLHPICRQWLPNPSERRRTESLEERPFNLEAINNVTLEELGGGGNKQPETFFYLAYGSNLASETFQGRRGIRPLSQLNVLVPELVMTFDLAGLPYVEPCFANTKYRKPSPPLPPPDSSSKVSNLSPRSKKPKYHKTRWTKGLVGVVYEVTRADFAHIIATEGGGASYQDVLVDCYELPPGQDTVPEVPTTDKFVAHTLYSPVYAPGTKPPSEGGRISRPDPDFAQPSARYLKLITDGADEHALPREYKEYLDQLRPYMMSNQRQRLGAFIFGMIWLPFISLVFGLNNRLADKKGRAPAWLVAITGALFRGMWMSYDGFFYGLFGDGERTVYDDDDDDDDDDEIVAKGGVRSMRYRDLEPVEKSPEGSHMV